MRRLLCFILGHGQDKVHSDGLGAAWAVCSRCGKLRAAHTWHGGKPWEV